LGNQSSQGKKTKGTIFWGVWLGEGREGNKRQGTIKGERKKRLTGRGCHLLKQPFIKVKEEKKSL